MLCNLSADYSTSRIVFLLTPAFLTAPRRNNFIRTASLIYYLTNNHKLSITDLYAFSKSAEMVMRESGCRQEHHAAPLFRKHVMEGQWQKTETTLHELKPLIKNQKHLPVSLSSMDYICQWNIVIKKREFGNYYITYPRTCVSSTVMFCRRVDGFTNFSLSGALTQEKSFCETLTKLNNRMGKIIHA